MLHALDYSNMEVGQLKYTISESKRKDKEMAKFVRFVFKVFQLQTVL